MRDVILRHPDARHYFRLKFKMAAAYWKIDWRFNKQKTERRRRHASIYGSPLDGGIYCVLWIIIWTWAWLQVLYNSHVWQKFNQYSRWTASLAVFRSAG